VAEKISDNTYRVRNLIPGSSYSCTGAAIYTKAIVAEPVVLNISMPFFEYSITPGVNTIEVYVPNYKGTIQLKYFKNHKSRGNTTFVSTHTLENLMIGTEYKICLSINDKCGNIENCTTLSTLEDFPSAPNNLELKNNGYYPTKEPKLTLTWSAPENSGKILNYNIRLTSNCPKTPGLFCEQESLTSTFQHIPNENPQLLYDFKVEAFCVYRASVAAKNSKGQGPESSSNEVETPPEVKLPERIDIVPNVFKMTVNIYPGCPFTGPIDYKIKVFSNQGNLILATNLSFDGKVGTDSTVITNLLMGTKYNVCVCIDDCRNTQNHNCTRKKTLEAPPSAPTNVKIAPSQSWASNFVLTWSAPNNSGLIIGYNYTINITCPVSSVETCTQKINTTLGHQTNLRFDFYADPFCQIEASVVALNSKGPGEIAVTNFTTPGRAKHPQNVTLIPNPFNIIVNVYPGCPFTGPFDYTVIFSDHAPRGLQHDGNKEWLTTTFDNLTPAKQYTACISAPGLDAKCYQSTTVQIPPEDSPIITWFSSSESVLNLQVQKPEKSYQMEKELLVYNFFIQSDCIQVDNQCSNTNCILNYTEVRKSQLETFTLKLSGLEPYMNYQIKSKAKNQAGEGPWGNWSQWFDTKPASDNTLRKIIANFSPSSSNDAIHLDLHPVCPYRGAHYSLTHLVV
jgi:hypothetical protein